MGEASYKAQKGLIRVRASVEEGIIRDLMITGDFFMYPEDLLWRLEGVLKGSEADRTFLVEKIRSFYMSTGVVTPGVTPQDFAEAITKAASIP